MPRQTAIDAARKFRQQLSRQEADSVERMARIYQRIGNSLQDDVVRLAGEIALMDDPTKGSIMRLARMKSILEQVNEQVTRFGGTVKDEVTLIGSQATQAGIDNALKLIEHSLPDLPDEVRNQIRTSFARLPSDAVEAAAGLTGKDSPFNERYAKLYGDWTAEQVGEHITDGIAKGQNPREIARTLNRNLTDGLGRGLTSAMSTVRTAQIKSYQTANHATYRANDDVVKGWIWLAELGPRTCFPAGVVITTKRGLVPIEGVIVGDSVLTHTGKWQRVIEVMARSYSDEMVTVESQGVKLTATKDHPLLIERQGKLDWIEISRCRIGDNIICNPDDLGDIFNHFRIQLSIKGGIRNTKDSIASGLKPDGFSGISIFNKFLAVPIDAVYFNNGVDIGQEKINRIAPTNKGMLLDILNPKILKAKPNVLFRLCLTHVSSIAFWGTKLLCGISWNGPKLFSASQAGIDNRRSPANLGAILSVGFGFSKYLTTSGARGILNSFELAFIRAKNLIPLRWVKDKFLSASRADLFGLRCLHSALFGAIDSLSFIAGLKLFTALRASFNFTRGSSDAAFSMGMLGLMSGITVGGTELAASLFDPGGRYIELVSTSKASSNHSDIIPRNAHHSKLVYNIEVEEDHSYFANGFIVHNCLSCIALHGSIHPLEEELNDHDQGRCAPLPIPISYADLGLDIPEDIPEIESGEDWFNRQPESVQRDMMGKGKFEAWQNGDFEFNQLSKPYDSQIYGELRREATLEELTG